MCPIYWFYHYGGTDGKEEIVHLEVITIITTEQDIWIQITFLLQVNRIMCFFFDKSDVYSKGTFQNALGSIQKKGCGRKYLKFSLTFPTAKQACKTNMCNESTPWKLLDVYMASWAVYSSGILFCSTKKKNSLRPTRAIAIYSNCLLSCIL